VAVFNSLEKEKHKTFFCLQKNIWRQHKQALASFFGEQQNSKSN